MNVDHHAFGVDIGDLEMQSFVQSQAQMIDDGKVALHRWFLDQFEKRLHLADRDQHRQLLFDFDASEFQDRPVAWTGEAIVQLEGLQSHVDRAGAPLLRLGDEQ